MSSQGNQLPIFVHDPHLDPEAAVGTGNHFLPDEQPLPAAFWRRLDNLDRNVLRQLSVRPTFREVHQDRPHVVAEEPQVVDAPVFVPLVPALYHAGPVFRVRSSFTQLDDCVWSVRHNHARLESVEWLPVP